MGLTLYCMTCLSRIFKLHYKYVRLHIICLFLLGNKIRNYYILDRTSAHQKSSTGKIQSHSLVSFQMPFPMLTGTKKFYFAITHKPILKFDEKSYKKSTV